MRYQYIPIRMAKIQKTDNTNCWQGCRTIGTSIFAGGNMKQYGHFGRQAVSYKVKHLLYDPAILLLYIYPPKWKFYVHTKICTLMFKAALFIIIKNWKQSRYLSIDEGKNKQWYIHRMKYLVTKRNQPSSHKNTWMNLNCILLS